MHRHRLVRQVKQFLDRLQGAGGLVVAVSGGPDSVALLCALVALRWGGDRPLVVAHLNHQFRGAESDADEAFVRGLHSGLATAGAGKLQLHCQRLDVAAQARATGDNLEQVARQLRYTWLTQVAQETGSRWVATGHTADDQAETVLQRLLRGTGLKGLRGIAPRRELSPEVQLVRPLLRVRRCDVLAYLEAVSQPYRQDRSNFDLARTRNRIRHELLPYLAERYNASIVALLARLAEQAEEAFGHTQAHAEALLHEAERPRAGRFLVFDRACLLAAPRWLVREMFRRVWAREGWPEAGMSFEHWNRLAALALGEATAGDLPGGIHARCRERVVQVGMLC